jgi:hypothetical protein
MGKNVRLETRSVISYAYKTMSDRTDASELDWRHLCKEARLELDPQGFLRHIAEVRAAILDQIDSGLPSEEERMALHDALCELISLHEVAKRELARRWKSGE